MELEEWVWNGQFRVHQTEAAPSIDMRLGALWEEPALAAKIID